MCVGEMIEIKRNVVYKSEKGEKEELFSYSGGLFSLTRIWNLKTKYPPSHFSIMVKMIFFLCFFHEIFFESCHRVWDPFLCMMYFCLYWNHEESDSLLQFFVSTRTILAVVLRLVSILSKNGWSHIQFVYLTYNLTWFTFVVKAP